MRLVGSRVAFELLGASSQKSVASRLADFAVSIRRSAAVSTHGTGLTYRELFPLGTADFASATSSLDVPESVSISLLAKVAARRLVIKLDIPLHPRRVSGVGRKIKRETVHFKRFRPRICTTFKRDPGDFSPSPPSSSTSLLLFKRFIKRSITHRRLLQFKVWARSG